MTLSIGVFTAFMVMFAFIAIGVGPGILRNRLLVSAYSLMLLGVGLMLADHFQIL